jgi:MOSC domain-containing protein YiiM
MRVLSVNVGLPREVTWRGKPVRTGIYKEPVRGRVASHERPELELGPGAFGENLTTEGLLDEDVSP